MPSCICIGDPHFKSANVLELDAYCKRIYTIVKDKAPDFVVVMGDLLDRHERIDVEPYNRAIEFLRKLSKYTATYLLIGNHDFINNQQYLTSNHGFNALKYWDPEKYDITIVDKVEVLTSDCGEFFLCPYVPNGRFVEALNDSGEAWDEAVCIFAHQEFKRCKMGAKVSEDGDEWLPEYPLVISGHIHDEQTVGDNIRYVGSSMQHAFGESCDKCIYYMVFSDIDEPVFERISLGLREKRIVYVTNDEIEKFDPTKYVNSEGVRSSIKLVIQSTSAEFQTFRKSDTYKRLVSEGVKIECRTEDDGKIVELKEINRRNSNYIEIMEELVSKEDQGVVKTYNEICGSAIKNVELVFDDAKDQTYECSSGEEEIEAEEEIELEGSEACSADSDENETEDDEQEPNIQYV